MFRDITRRRAAEEQLRQAMDTMEARVRERTAALSRVNEQLVLEVTERKAAEEAVRAAELKYRSLFENAMEGIFQADLQGRIVDANPAMSRIFGYRSPEELVRDLSDENVTLFEEDGSRDEFISLLMDKGEVLDFESQICRKDDTVIWINQNARAVRDQAGEVLFYEGSVEDVTERKEAHKRLEYQAFHDPLTGLPNRPLFLDHLKLAMSRGLRRSDYIYAVLYMDLDRFKIINDSLGHSIGDELLETVARKLEICVRDVDTIARFGGDEFAVLLEDLAAPREAIKIAKRILEEISTPFMLGGYVVHTSASIGIVLNTEGYATPDLVLRDADTAMYRAKELGKARFKVFTQKMHDQAMRLLEMETELRKAVERGEFTVHYQPVIDLENGTLAGFEALVRWVHPDLGTILPGEFIPLAEDTGLIFPIGEWVFRTVCRQLCAWQERFPGSPFVRVSVNLSPKQFIQPGLVAMIQDIIQETGADPQKLTMEITESVLMNNAVAAVDMLAKLKRLGLELSIDDFGTGYSSLSYLRQFPVDILKVDRSFVKGFDTDNESQAIVKSVVGLARNLGLAVIAEGVDKPEQVMALRDLGCNYAQGFLFSRAIPPEEAERLMEDDAPLRMTG